MTYLRGVLVSRLQSEHSKAGCLGVADRDRQVRDGGVTAVNASKGSGSCGVDVSLGTSNDQQGTSLGQDSEVGVKVDGPCAG